jgi:hypothetical protein
MEVELTVGMEAAAMRVMEEVDMVGPDMGQEAVMVPAVTVRVTAVALVAKEAVAAADKDISRIKS